MWKKSHLLSGFFSIYIDLTNLDNIDINAKDKIAQALNQDYKELD